MRPEPFSLGFRYRIFNSREDGSGGVDASEPTDSLFSDS